MEKEANYALVGLSTLILFAGLVIFVIWLARISLNRDYDTYDIVFQGPVRGLSQGGEVHFNGIKVGEVTKIQLAKNPNVPYKPAPPTAFSDIIAGIKLAVEVTVSIEADVRETGGATH